MSVEQILAVVRGLDGVLELAPPEGSAFPEISWGDHFFYYAPDGMVPQNRQPYATIVTKDYPDDVQSRLDGPGRWRLNIHVGTATSAGLLGGSAHDATRPDAAQADVVLPHPVYGPLGWIAIVNPGEQTMSTALDLLREAHDADRRRVERRPGNHPGQPL